MKEGEIANILLKLLTIHLLISSCSELDICFIQLSDEFYGRGIEVFCLNNEKPLHSSTLKQKYAIRIRTGHTSNSRYHLRRTT